MSELFPRLGQAVTVTWGLDEVQAEVIETYGSGELGRVRVKLPILGCSGEPLDFMEIALKPSEVSW